MTARGPLTDRAADLERLGAVEVRFLTQLDVRVHTQAAERFGFPIEPNTFVRAHGRDVLWLGPDEWLIVAEPGRAGELAASFERALTSEHRSVVDVSAARAVMDLTGPNRHDLLASGCPLDLHRRSWSQGRCAQTVFGTPHVLLQERDGVTRLFVRPSYADHVVELLLAALD